MKNNKFIPLAIALCASLAAVAFARGDASTVQFAPMALNGAAPTAGPTPVPSPTPVPACAPVGAEHCPADLGREIVVPTRALRIVAIDESPALAPTMVFTGFHYVRASVVMTLTQSVNVIYNDFAFTRGSFVNGAYGPQLTGVGLPGALEQSVPRAAGDVITGDVWFLVRDDAPLAEWRVFVLDGLGGKYGKVTP